MRTTDQTGTAPRRLQRLLGFLERDPDNLSLLADAATAAVDESDIQAAETLLSRYRAIGPLTPAMLNIEGLVALRQQRFTDAAIAFEALLEGGVNDPSARFNLAWVRAVQGEHQAALDLLDNDVVATVPRAAALKVQMLHHLGLIEEALACGGDLVASYPNNDALLGALSVAAMDADDLQLAQHYAGQAKGGADAVTTQGLLLLGADQPAASLALFDEALEEHPDAPRAWLGKGLGLMALGNTAEAAQCLDRGARIFGDHLGSWIAAGWAHFISKDLKASRSSFDHVLALDDSFAEGHGALAVLDIAEGDIKSARRRTDIALRLDPQCFGGALARTLLLEARGDAALAAKIRERAMNLPIGPDGKTLAQALIGLGMSFGQAGDPAR